MMIPKNIRKFSEGIDLIQETREAIDILGDQLNEIQPKVKQQFE